MLRPATFSDIESEPLGTGRLYQVTQEYRLAAFPVDAPLPHAPHGALVYVWLRAGSKGVGRWDWTADPEAIGAIVRAFRRGTAPNYRPPDRRLPDGSYPMIRPTNENLLERAMDAARPGPPLSERKVLQLHVSLEGGLTPEDDSV